MSNEQITTQDHITQQVESFMAKDTSIQQKKELQISAIQATDERLTGGAGLALFALYIDRINLLPVLDQLFGSIRKNAKGIPVTNLIV